MGHAYSPSRSNLATGSRWRQKRSVLGRSEKPIRPQNRSANHLKLRSSQQRRRRSQSFTKARDRTARKWQRTLGTARVIRHRGRIPFESKKSNATRRQHRAERSMRRRQPCRLPTGAKLVYTQPLAAHVCLLELPKLEIIRDKM